MSPRWILLLAAVILAVVFLALSVPQIVSVVRLNSANVLLAHALALPTDSPDRGNDLATSALSLRDSPADLPRLGLARARTAMSQGDAQGAYAHLANAVQSDSLGEFVRGNAAWQAGNEDAAIDHWRISGAYAFFAEQTIREMGAHDWETAARYADIAVRIDPSNALAHLFLADALSRQSPVPSRANQELDETLRLAQGDELRSTAISMQAELLFRAGDAVGAESRFRDAIKVAPKDARPRTGLALVLLSKHPPERERATAVLSEVVEDSPWYTAAYIALADNAEKTNDLAAAEIWLLKGLDANAKNAHLLSALGDFYLRNRQYEKARTSLILAMKYETHGDELQRLERQLAELIGP